MSYNIYQLAVLMHRKYEESSKRNNWNTQGNCKVEFDDLPEANKKVMLDVAEFVWNEIDDEKKQGAVDVLDKIIKLVREMPNADDRYNKIIKGAIPKMLDGGSVHRFTLIKELKELKEGEKK